MSAEGQPPLGILAGGGRLPLEVAEAVVSAGRGVHIVALDGEADQGIVNFPHTVVNWGAVGQMLEAFRLAGCREIVILGSVRRPNLRKIRPDWGFVRVLPALMGMLKGGDDSVLRRVVGMFEAQGLVVRGVHEVAPGLVVAGGDMGTARASPAARDAIAVGRRALRVLGPYDLGQAVVAGPRGVVDIEGAEGTDGMLRRVGRRELASNGALDGARVLIKAPKPGQEIRVDMPTIGPMTVALARAAGLEGVAVECGRVLVADKDATIREANAAGLFVLGYEGDGYEDGDQQLNSQPVPRSGFVAHGGGRVGRMEIDDAVLGSSLLADIEPFWGGGVVAVSRGYVLGVGHGGEADAVIERARRSKPWGMRFLKRGVGVVVATPMEITEATIEGLSKAGFAALALAGARWDVSEIERIVVAGQRARIAVLIGGEGLA